MTMNKIPKIRLQYADTYLQFVIEGWNHTALKHMGCHHTMTASSADRGSGFGTSPLFEEEGENQMKRLSRLLLLVLVTAAFTLGAVGCKTNDEHPHSDHPSNEHPQ